MAHRVTITSKQIKAARALLDWSQDDLAKAADISVATIRKLELGSISPRLETYERLKSAMENVGLEFIEPNGVREKPEEVTIYEGHEGMRSFYDDVYAFASSKGGEIVTVCLDEDAVDAALEEHAKVHMDRMMGLLHKVDVKCILTENTGSTPARHCEYRSLSKAYVDSVPFYIYGNNYAVFLFGAKPSPKIIVHHSVLLADAYRKQFRSMWDKATPIFVPEHLRRAKSRA